MLALRTCEVTGEIWVCLAAFLSLVERGVYTPEIPGSSKGGFLDFLMVTFLKRIKSRGKVEGEKGFLSENIERVVRSEGSSKAGASRGLDEVAVGNGTVHTGGDKGGLEDKEEEEDAQGREGKWSNVKGGGPSTTESLEEGGGSKTKRSSRFPIGPERE